MSRLRTIYKTENDAARIPLNGMRAAQFANYEEFLIETFLQ